MQLIEDIQCKSDLKRPMWGMYVCMYVPHLRDRLPNRLWKLGHLLSVEITFTFLLLLPYYSDWCMSIPYWASRLDDNFVLVIGKAPFGGTLPTFEEGEFPLSKTIPLSYRNRILSIFLGFWHLLFHASLPKLPLSFSCTTLWLSLLECQNFNFNMYLYIVKEAIV